MNHSETKEEQNQTLSRVPLKTWRKFKMKCIEKDLTMTAGFIEAVTLWMNKEG